MSEDIEGRDDCLQRNVVPLSDPGSETLVEVDESAIRVFVGAGARVLFYPTLLYNVVRNKFQEDFRWWDHVDQFVLLGAVPFPGDVLRLKAIGVRAVVTLNESYETLVPKMMYQNQGINHLVIPTRDYLFAPSIGDIRRAVAFIYDHVKIGQTVYVHCKAGRGRSTTVVVCYLVEHRGMNPIEAFQYVQRKRPRVLLATAQWQAVQEYSRQVRLHHGPKAPLTFQQCLPCFMNGNAPHELENPVLNIMRTEAVGSCKLGSLDIEEVPVIITGVDLRGYRSIEDAGLIGNGLWKGLGVVYQVQFVAARSVENAVRVARASVEWARLSCLVMGCQTEGNQVLHSHSHLTVDGFHSLEGVPVNKPMTNRPSLAKEMSMATLSLAICQSVQ